MNRLLQLLVLYRRWWLGPLLVFAIVLALALFGLGPFDGARPFTYTVH